MPEGRFTPEEIMSTYENLNTAVSYRSQLSQANVVQQQPQISQSLHQLGAHQLQHYGPPRVHNDRSPLPPPPESHGGGNNSTNGNKRFGTPSYFDNTTTQCSVDPGTSSAYVTSATSAANSLAAVSRHELNHHPLYAPHSQGNITSSDLTQLIGQSNLTQIAPANLSSKYTPPTQFLLPQSQSQQQQSFQPQQLQHLQLLQQQQQQQQQQSQLQRDQLLSNLTSMSSNADSSHSKIYQKIGEPPSKKQHDSLDKVDRTIDHVIKKTLTQSTVNKFRNDSGLSYSSMKLPDDTDGHGLEHERYSMPKDFVKIKQQPNERAPGFIFNNKDMNHFPLLNVNDENKKLDHMLYSHVPARKFEGSPANSGYDSASSQNEMLGHMPLQIAHDPGDYNLNHMSSSNNGIGSQQQRKQTGEYSSRSRQAKYDCSLCNFTCRKQIELINHVQIHPDEKPFHCPHCDYKGSKYHYLRNHLLTHSEYQVHQCPECDYRCVQRGSLKVHMRRHSEEKRFACTMCPYRSHFKGNLKLHIRIHTGEKPYACSECDFRCTQSGSLKIHMRGHTGEKPYACDMCDYRSKHKGNLVMHRRKHTGDKPFVCDRCDYKSSQKMALTKHIKTVHGGVTLAEEINEHSHQEPEREQHQAHQSHPHHHLLDTERNGSAQNNAMPTDYSMLQTQMRLPFGESSMVDMRSLPVLNYKQEKEDVMDHPENTEILEIVTRPDEPQKMQTDPHSFIARPNEPQKMQNDPHRFITRLNEVPKMLNLPHSFVTRQDEPQKMQNDAHSFVTRQEEPQKMQNDPHSFVTRQDEPQKMQNDAHSFVTRQDESQKMQNDPHTFVHMTHTSMATE